MGTSKEHLCTNCGAHHHPFMACRPRPESPIIGRKILEVEIFAASPDQQARVVIKLDNGVELIAQDQPFRFVVFKDGIGHDFLP